MKTTVLVADGEQRSALACVRSLGRAGYDVLVCSTRRRSLAGASKFARAQFAVRDPLREAAGFLEDVRAVVERREVSVVLPVTEASILALLPTGGRIGPAVIPVPMDDRFRQICDKQRVLAVAAELGIGVPRQHRLDAPADLAAAAGRVSFPAVIKPARSVTAAGRKTAVRFVTDADGLTAAVAEYPADAYPLLVQQRIVGPGIGVFLLVWDGDVRAAFSHIRLREKPPAGGVSVLRASLKLDPTLLELSRRLLERFNWQGVAMVEYKVDAATRRPYLMEVNGRFWGSLQLAVDARVDFPAQLVALALGRAAPQAAVGGYPEGIRSRWFWGDVDHLLVRLRRSPRTLALPARSPSRARVVIDFLRSWNSWTREEIFEFGDPMPFARESLDWIRGR